jgi:carboxymethylenebutenolidase
MIPRLDRDIRPSKELLTMERKPSSEFPQPLLDLFHEYVHGDIDRRAFIERAGRFSVGGLTGAGLLAALQPNFAWAQQVQPDDPRIRTEQVTVASPRGNGKITGHFARPAADGKYPAVLVVHENRGLNPYVEDVARRLATSGFIAYAPDGLTSVGGYPGDEDKARALFPTVDREKMTEDFIASVGWLETHANGTGSVGVVGFCFGGTIANTLAVRMSDLNAVVSFYGGPPPLTDVPRIRAAVLVHHGEADQKLAATWPDYQKALAAAGVRHEGHVYPGAQHGFHNDTTPRYDEAAARLAWSRTLAWFNRYLRTS